ncbi:MAG TPA: aminotransferase class I/II-fold pyridoxal phosphate-dependent enzyme [Vicinamibacterales bacterium]|nr:aminotransferase class I/II-fold pyridoxal phosphate-dependent enzyme [Vicinamibacterales bacterium]
MRISRRTLLGRLAAGAAAAAAAPRVSVKASGTTVGALAPEPIRSVKPIRLHRSENVHGPSPRVMKTLQEAAGRPPSRYPDEEVEALRHKIAGVHGVDPAQVIIGCGSSEIVRMAVDAFAGPQRKILAALPTFELIHRYARRAGAEVDAVLLTKEWSHDLSAMLERAHATGLVYIGNPNNPTGTLTRRQDLEEFLRRLPADVVVLIDEAYHHYVGEAADYASFIDRPVDHPRVVVTRTFSKIHGMAGLRVGYAVAAAQTARTLDAHALSDGVSVTAARAAATALDDADYVRMSVDWNADDRQEFLNQANARMLRSIDSLTNFVMLNAGRPAGPVFDHFMKHDILLARPVPALDSYIRVSLGTSDDMREFWRVWDLMPGGHVHG